MNFSEREGLNRVDRVLTVGAMKTSTRNRLWNVLDQKIWKSNGFVAFQTRPDKCEIGPLSRAIWNEFFEKPIDERPYWAENTLKEIRDFFFGCKWHRVFDFLEFLIAHQQPQEIERFLNVELQETFAGYRFVNESAVPITDPVEVQAITEVIEAPYVGVRAHIQSALHHMSNRENPDYRNSIKESISAVESLCKALTGNDKATLGDALRVLEDRGLLHPALRKGMTAFYGYTSDEDGIRHAMLEEPRLTADDAKFFLVSCATFSNYMISKTS